jgi:Lon protease-like protein
MSDIEIPLFPLNTVLFPGGPLPLRIFEPRYLDMISRCLKHDHGFGVVLIRDGPRGRRPGAHLRRRHHGAASSTGTRVRTGCWRSPRTARAVSGCARRAGRPTG